MITKKLGLLILAVAMPFKLYAMDGNKFKTRRSQIHYLIAQQRQQLIVLKRRQAKLQKELCQLHTVEFPIAEQDALPLSSFCNFALAAWTGAAIALLLKGIYL